MVSLGAQLPRPRGIGLPESWIWRLGETWSNQFHSSILPRATPAQRRAIRTNFMVTKGKAIVDEGVLSSSSSSSSSKGDCRRRTCRRPTTGWSEDLADVCNRLMLAGSERPPYIGSRQTLISGTRNRWTCQTRCIFTPCLAREA